MLTPYFEMVRQVRQLGLENAIDLNIWQFAQQENLAIVTFDSDFIDISNLKSHPPKVIWLRFGNSNNLKIANKLISNIDVIK